MCIDSSHIFVFRRTVNPLEWAVTEERGLRNVVNHFQCQLSDSNLPNILEAGNCLVMATGEKTFAHFAITAGIKHGRIYVIHDPGYKGKDASQNFAYEPLDNVICNALIWAVLKCKPDVDSTLCQLATTRRAFSVLTNDNLFGIKAYHMLKRNCEHFVNYSVNFAHMSTSRQVFRHIESLFNIVVSCVVAGVCFLLPLSLVPRIVCAGTGAVVSFKLADIVASKMSNDVQYIRFEQQINAFSDEIKPNLDVLMFLKMGDQELTPSVIAMLDEIKTEMFGILCLENARPEKLEEYLRFKGYLSDINELILQFLLNSYGLTNAMDSLKPFSISSSMVSGMLTIQKFLCNEPALCAPCFHVYVFECVGLLLKMILRAPPTLQSELCFLVCADIIERYDDTFSATVTGFDNQREVQAFSRIAQRIRETLEEVRRNKQFPTCTDNVSVNGCDARNLPDESGVWDLSRPTISARMWEQGLLAFLGEDIGESDGEKTEDEIESSNDDSCE